MINSKGKVITIPATTADFLVSYGLVKASVGCSILHLNSEKNKLTNESKIKLIIILKIIDLFPFPNKDNPQN